MESALDSVGGVTDVAVNLATVRATDLFPGKVDYFKALPGLGACGVVNGKKCILGNLRLMQREGAAMNGLDEEARVFAAEGKTCVFWRTVVRLWVSSPFQTFRRFMPTKLLPT